MEVTSLSRRFWPQMDSSTLQTQYWEPIGPAGEGVPVYAMDSSSSNPRQSVGHERKEKDLRASRKAGSHPAARSAGCKIIYKAFLAVKHLPCPVITPTQVPYQAS